MKRTSIFFTLFILLQTILPAQGKKNSYTLTGTVIDSLAEKALPYVSVLVSSFSDGKYLAGATADDKGNFTIPNISEEVVRVKFSFTGYQSSTADSIDLKRTAHIGVIKLIPSSYEMTEVVVKAEKPMIETYIDKQVINIDMVPGNAGTLAEVLRNSSAVDVDPQSNKISVRGQEMKIELDGHPVENYQDMLAQMPAEMFDRVEVILSPDAKESAEGGAYILNLISKKSVLDHLNGSASISTATSNRNTGTLNLNYKENKMNFFGSFTGVRGGNKNISSVDQINYRSAALYRQSSGRNSGSDFRMVTAKSGVDYTLDENNFFTVFGLYSYYDGTGHNQSDNVVRDNRDRQLYSFVNSGNSVFSSYHSSVTGFYKRKLEGEGHELTADLYYMQLGIPADHTVNIFYSTIPAYPEQQKSTTDLRAHTLVVRLNYLLPVFSGSVETGYNFTARKRENEYASLNYSYQQNSWQDSLNLSNVFQYRENIHAIYATYSRTAGNFEIKTGVRTEALVTDGRQVTTLESFTGKFMNVFPNLNIAYKWNSEWQIALNMFRRVTYPQLEYVNPFRIYNGPNNFSEGNPQLGPYSVSSYGLSLSGYLSAYYLRSTGIISNVTTVSDDSISLNKYINLNSGKTIGLDLTLPYTKFLAGVMTLPDFITTGSFQFAYRYYKQFGEFGDENLTYSDKTWNLRGLLLLHLWYDVNASLSFYYRPGNENIRTRDDEFKYAAISFSKGFLDQKLRMSFTVNDLFNTAGVRNEMFGSNYYIRSYSKNPNSRAVYISFTYMFNNYKGRNDRTVDDGRDAGGNSE
ncbi:MAG: outer membrane beta-barrel protein [Bacteroidota bacterium]